MLTALRDVLRKTARSLGIEPALHLVQVQEAWPEVVGPVLAGAAEPRSLRAGVLLVATAHPHAAQEIRLRSEEILRGLSQRMPPVDLHQIRVVVREGQRSRGR